VVQVGQHQPSVPMTKQKLGRRRKKEKKVKTKQQQQRPRGKSCRTRLEGPFSSHLICIHDHRLYRHYYKGVAQRKFCLLLWFDVSAVASKKKKKNGKFERKTESFFSLLSFLFLSALFLVPSI
jgi:hypothetical protein